ncbi:glucose-1-phosphate adenylyltransferase [Chitinophaga terrae (ex Kim and Jung 2007)]|uniref:Glucose-1-phosphate adenylyltransferase n=1 Tax=Chitinophaga terrae (ex Kim and Jung 2007) TaxID=408074 RepID=A0A1H4AL25_9BACT|nr:glucose-1-phosphate adenylyltransferase [Chitinophaga terrae (ex Kim and Jung 2007)]MDQ0106629.1 glucose-1-phosphate adenylyltransferase [Chitinophaga terrae (ex Kim and Jung 2007)]GEP89273.1 glucose-1-phosphate adenylyltransferase [Chitinophaga terrae (ex Kim and Jung 2007)]SEA36663.1 glucose-1-phosphate adenylyltransferase [Chitinophaga terrae (ex Kim and Jung 2007)]
MTNDVMSIILGGGAGTRLYPLTRRRSKPAVPLAGKYRLVDIPISNCLNAELNRIFVLTQFNSASLNKHIKNTYHFSNFDKGFVDILAAEQTPDNPTWYQGTADAVRQCMHHLENFDYKYILILSGDQLYQMDFKKMIQHHIDSNAEISIATIPVKAEEASDFGILKEDASGAITSFTEKPSQAVLPPWASEVSEEMKQEGRIYLASMGIYIFNKDVLQELLNNQPEAADFGKQLIPHAIESKRRIFSYQYEGYWTDIGNIHSFFEANIRLTDDIPPFNLYDNANTIYSRARMLPPAKISGTMHKTMIADGCIIMADRLERVVVGIRTRIGKGTVINDAYIMGSDYYQTLEEIEKAQQEGRPTMGIGENCVISNAIIDKNCAIGNGVHINGGKHLADGDFEKYTVKDGIVVVKKGSVLEDGFSI